MKGAQKKKEVNLLVIVLITIVLTTAVWFGVKCLRNNSVMELEAQRQDQAQERSQIIPMGTSVAVTGIEVTNPDEDYSPVTGWLGTMEFAVTDATLYESLDAFEASEDSFYISESGEVGYARSNGFEPSILVVSVQATNRDARSIDAAEDGNTYASLIDLGDFRVGIGSCVAPEAALASVDESVNPASGELLRTVSLSQGETKQVRLAFFLIPKENYESVIDSLDGDERMAGGFAAIYENYVYENNDELTLCLGYSSLGLESKPRVDAIPYVFELGL